MLEMEDNPGKHGELNSSAAEKETQGASTVNDSTGREQHDTSSLDAKLEAKEVLKKLKGDLSFAIEDVPPWYTSIILGFQHYLTMFGATVAVPLFLSEALCIRNDLVALGEVIGTIFFVSGIATLLQTTFGCRLPIVQGATFSLLVPAIAILSLRGDCPAPLNENSTAEEKANATAEWQSRILELQGSIMVSSCFQVFIGATGILGLMLNYIGPLSIAPTITLVSLSLFGPAADFAGQHWGMSVLTIILMVIMSQYISRFHVPCAGYSSEEKCHVVRYPVFKLYPVVLSVMFAWFISYILTVAGAFPNDPATYGYEARTDTRIEVLQQSAWFRFPYPGQWGVPTVTVAGVFGMIAGVLASVVESIGDYFACARLAGAPPPPVHAVNRGIMIEGFASILAGAWGSGNGTTSYGENIGAIGITKVGSRRVVQYGGIVMLFFGTFAKFGALFVTIPDPIVGGMFFVMFGMVVAVGISNVQFVDLNSSRNLFVLGFALFTGLALPYWLKLEENKNFFNTGVKEIDNIFTVLLSTSMFVGGFVGFVLDNSIPGTDEERGMREWRQLFGSSEEGAEVRKHLLKCYEFPFGMKYIRDVKLFSYLPFSPTFRGFNCRCPRCCNCYKRNTVTINDGNESV
ncbi:solute carrier family 23 member 1-like [Amphiura filiformis]|uniref:solute carrier family 23 member 1-like n=1 Tax=Amphiura filiformis TaxID=82378 RepID=UPI003B21D200